MRNTLASTLSIIGSGNDKKALQDIMQYLADSLSTLAVSTAGLVITATSGKKVPKTGSADSYYLVRGVLVKIASGTDMPALSGTVTNAYFNVFCHFVDAAGTKTTVTGTQATALGTVKFPDFPIDKALIGFTIVNPTGTGDFVGNTTALDDGTVVPNAVYISPVGAVDPTILYS